MMTKAVPDNESRSESNGEMIVQVTLTKESLGKPTAKLVVIMVKAKRRRCIIRRPVARFISIVNINRTAEA